MTVLFDNPKYNCNVENIARTCDFFGIPFYVTNTQRIKPKISGGVLKDRPLKILNPGNWSGRIIVTSDKAVRPFDSIEIKPDDLWVFGNETNGVSTEIWWMADAVVGIKSQGIVPCLNVSNAVAFIIGYNLQRRE